MSKPRPRRPICRSCGEAPHYDMIDRGRYWRVGAAGTVPVLDADGRCPACATAERSA